MISSSNIIPELASVTTTKQQTIGVNQSSNHAMSSNLQINQKCDTQPQPPPPQSSQQHNHHQPQQHQALPSDLTPFISSQNVATKRNALLTALNCVYESVESNDSTESLLAEAVKKVDTPDAARLLRALTIATNDLEFDKELGSNISDSMARIPSRFFEQQSAAKGVNVSEVRKEHNRQLLLQGNVIRELLSPKHSLIFMIFFSQSHLIAILIMIYGTN